MPCRPTGDFDGQLRSIIGARRYIFNLPQCQQSVDHLSKDDMLSIEEIACSSRDEELHPVKVSLRCSRGIRPSYLATVGVGSRIGLSVI